MAQDIAWILQDDQTRSTDQSKARIINLYPHQVGSIPPGNEIGKKPYVLQLRPGLKAFADNSGYETRGTYELNGVAYTVIDNTFYTCATDGTLTSHGTLNTSTGPVMWAATPDEITVIDGTTGYSYKISTNTFAQITDSEFPNGTKSLCMIDGYIICPVPNSYQFQISNINDAQTWNALNVASAEGTPDYIIRVFELNRQLWILKDNNFEVWFDSGATFPFQRIDGAFAKFGCAATNSIAYIHNTVAFLAKKKGGGIEVVRVDDLTPNRISTAAVDYAIAQYSTISDAEAFSYIQEGHEFYVLTFPTAKVTWVYDVNEQLWVEYSTTISGVADRWLPRCHMFLNNIHYVGIFNSGKIAQLDMDTHTDLGTAIKWTAQSFPITSRNYQKVPYLQVTHRLSISKLILDIDKGDGILNGTETILLEISRDGGHTFDSGQSVPASRYQDYTTRARWTNLGMCYSWVFRFSSSDPINWVLLGLEIEANIAST